MRVARFRRWFMLLGGGAMFQFATLAGPQGCDGGYGGQFGNAFLPGSSGPVGAFFNGRFPGGTGFLDEEDGFNREEGYCYSQDQEGPITWLFWNGRCD